MPSCISSMMYIYNEFVHFIMNNLHFFNLIERKKLYLYISISRRDIVISLDSANYYFKIIIIPRFILNLLEMRFK